MQNNLSYPNFHQYWHELVETYPNINSVTVGFSGGADSTFLLLGLCETRPSNITVKAIHFNHQVSVNASAWQAHCENVCSQLAIELEVFKLQFNSMANFESVAREKRLQIVNAQLKSNELYATGHHADDQVETFFMRLFRGSGLQGLSGIKRFSHYQGLKLWRPLLNVRKKQITHALKANNQSWVEDESNQSVDFTRNKIRHEFVPQCELFTDDVASKIQTTTYHLQMSQQVLNHYLDKELETCFHHSNCINLNQVTMSDAQVQLMVLRFLSKRQLSASADQVAQACEKLIAKEYHEISISKDVVMITERGFLLLAPIYQCAKFQISLANLLFTNGSATLKLPNNLGALRITECFDGARVLPEDLDKLIVTERPKGSLVRPHHREHSVKLKKYFQEIAMVKRLRDVVPIIREASSQRVIAVPGCCVDKSFMPKKGQKGYRFEWSELLLLK